MKPREDINMKHIFYSFVLICLCANFGFAADSALHQAHRANAFGIMNSEETDPEAMRANSGLDFDTRNPVAVHDNGKKGPTKNYTYHKADGTTKQVNFDPNIPQPSEAVDVTDETDKPNKNSAKTKDEKTQAPTQAQYSEYLKDWASRHKDPNDPSGEYARERNNPLPQAKAKKVYQYLKPGEENLPEKEKDRLEKSRKQAAERKAEKEDEEWVDPLTQAKTQEEVRGILKKEWLTPELKQVLQEYGVSEDEFIDKMIASNKKYQRSDYIAPKADKKPAQEDRPTEPAKQPVQNSTANEQPQIEMTQGMRMLLTVKGISPENVKPANNQPVNNQVTTVKKFRLAADIIQADKRLSEKEKQEFLEWNDKMLRLAEELKEKERQEQQKAEEEQRKLKEQEENRKRQTVAVSEEDLKYGNFNQICDPKIKNASSEACSLCCMHPKTRINGFDPNIHVMTHGFLYMGRPECHCVWQGKPLTGYDTRNTSNEACNAYCLAHPDDIKGFNPNKHQVHYGELVKGQCKCHYINKNIDICSREVVHKTDGACARCCMERPVNNRLASGFDPQKHNMLGGGVTKVGGCSCSYYEKPEMAEDKHAAVTGLSVNVPSVNWDDDDYTRAVCDTSTVHQNNGNCTKCCLAKNPAAPRIGHVLDYGYINDGQCKCHYRNPDASVCDNERKLKSDMGCYECCKAQPPAGFDPSTDEMDSGRVVGNNCECHWKTRPTSNDSNSCDYPYPLADGACEQCVNNRPRSQWDCEKCCGYIQRPGLYSSQYYTTSPAPGIQPGCICHFSDGKGLGF